MADINVQRRSSSAWIWVLAIIGAIVLLWAVVRGVDSEPELVPGSPGVHLIGDPQDFARIDVMSSVRATTGRDAGPSVA